MSKIDIFDHIELYDHLPMAVDSIMFFLKKHAMRGADLSDIRRKDVWSIPLGILREAVINALVHATIPRGEDQSELPFLMTALKSKTPASFCPA